MFEIIYNNCKYKLFNKKILFSLFKKDNYIIIKNKNHEYLISLISNDKILIDGLHQYSKEFIIKSNQQIKIELLNENIEKSELVLLYKKSIKNKIICKNGNICVIFIYEISHINLINNIVSDITNLSIYNYLDNIIIISKVKINLFKDNKKIKIYYFDEKINIIKTINKLLSNYNIKNDFKVIYIDSSKLKEYYHKILYYMFEKYFEITNLLNDYDVIGFKENDIFIHWCSSEKYIKLNLPIDTLNEKNYAYLSIGNFVELDNKIMKLDEIKNIVINNIKNKKILDNKIPIYGIYFICCIGNYLKIVNDQLELLLSSKLYKNTKKIYCFVCLYNDLIITILSKYDKIVIIKSSENLFEKFAINNIKKYLTEECYFYYIHSKSVTRNGQQYDDWRYICNYFTIVKWLINFELLKFYDCVGINLRFYPNIHFSGNFWWSKTDHIKKIDNINNEYLSPEMFICSKKNTNYISIHKSGIRHDVTVYEKKNYIFLNDEEILDNITNIPEFNLLDKYCTNNNTIITYNNFNHNDYYNIYKNEFNNNNKDFLWNHYINHGINENRAKCTFF